VRNPDEKAKAYEKLAAPNPKESISLLYKAKPVISSYGLYSISDMLMGIVGLHFSVYLSDYFNVRQSKRLFPIIFSGSKIGGVIGGAALTMAEKVGSFNMLILWLITLICGFLILKYIDSKFQPDVFDYEKHSKESIRFFQNIKGGWHFLKKSPLLKSIALGVFLLAFLSIIIKFLYSSIFVENYPNTDELMAFYGFFTIAANILGFLVQIFLSNRLIDSLGLGAANFSYAFAFSSGFLTIAAFYNLYSAIWARFTDEQLESAIQDPVEGLLYNAVPDRERTRAKALSSGLIKPISEIAASISLQIIKGTLSKKTIGWLGFLVSLIYIWVVHLQNKGYVNGLLQMVREKTISLEDLENLRWEKASYKDLETLYAMASGDDPSVRDSALLMLLHLDEEIDFDRLKKSFFQWSDEIQREFLKHYFRRWTNIDEEFLIKVLKKGKSLVKAFVIEYFIETISLTPKNIIIEFLHEKDLVIQNAAIRYLLIVGDAKEKALQVLKKRINSKEEKIISANLSIIRDMYDEGYLEYVKKLIDHPNKNISIDAINTLAAIYSPIDKDEKKYLNMVQELMKKGGFHNLKASAVLLGKKRGEKERNLLIKLLDTTSVPLRNLVVSILKANYSEDVNVYLKYLKSPYSSLNTKENIIFLLKQIPTPPNKNEIQKILKSFITEYFYIIKEQAWLLEKELSKTLMWEINERRKAHIRIIILKTLELILHQRVVLSIEKALLTKNPRLISSALELFENMWDKKQAKSLITLFSPESFDDEVKVARSFLPKVKISIHTFLDRYLDTKADVWGICACLLLIKKTEPSLLNHIDMHKFTSHPNSLVREVSSHIFEGKRRGERVLTTIEKVLYLKNAPIFKSLKMDELKMVADIVREMNFSPGDIIIEKGEIGNTMFIIASGKVEIFLPYTPPTTLAVLGESEFFGEMALFSEDVRSASAKALENTKLLCIERSHFFNLIYEKPDISIEIVKVLSERLRRMDEEMRHKRQE